MRQTFFKGALGALCALALITTSCSSKPAATPRPSTRPTPTPTPEPVYEAPLTGVISDSPVTARALAVKVGNSVIERPQTGLQDADIVYEELAEGGITRFIAIFQSKMPEVVGPVRSARIVDPDVLSPLKPLFAYAGGVDRVVANVASHSEITDVNVDHIDTAYHRSKDRKAPYNLYVEPSRLKSRAGNGAAPPPFFSWVPADAGTDDTSGEAGANVSFSFTPQSSSSYTFASSTGTYERLNSGKPHLLANGNQVGPVNVVFQFVAITAGQTIDANGQRSPDTSVIGSGEAIVLRGGRAFRGRWERAGVGPTKFTGPDGQPLLLARGQTYVELIPQGRTVTIS